MRGLEGKTVIVTGGGGSIGRAICLRYAEYGCKIGVFDLNAERALETCTLIEKSGGKGYPVECDISDHAAVKKAVSGFEKAAGPTQILVNNAGWDKLVNFIQTDTDFWNKIIGINLHGPLNLHHAVLPGMVERGYGRIVNIASDAGRVGSSGEAVYSACKGGIIAFSKTVAREVARKGVTLNCVCPGPTDTHLLAEIAGDGAMGDKIRNALINAVPMKRVGKPDDIPGAVLFLSSDDASFITGQTISVSGGLTMAG
jgi:2-hydroxycyclohexanecarboxyl-CoA dehydrogenase